MVNFIDEFEGDVERLIKADFGAPQPGQTFRLRFIDWMHYRARLIPRTFKTVVVSSSVNAARPAYPAIDKIETALRGGEDVSPWLSNRIRLRRADGRADLLFNDWQVSHFHLGRIFEARDRINRTKSLLFAHITLEQAVLIDVGDHKSFASQALLATLLETCPPVLERFELKGLRSPRATQTDDEIAQMRNGGAACFAAINGRLFMPGQGISTSRHATRIVAKFNRLIRALRNLQEQLRTNAFPVDRLRQLAFPVTKPVVIGARWDDALGLIVYDKNRSVTFLIEPPPT